MVRPQAMLFFVLFAGAAACEKQAPPPNPNQAPQGLPPSPQALQNVHGGSDPHANLHGDPHAGMAMGGSDIDPNQRMPQIPEDPTKFLEGTIDVAPALKDQVKPGDILFLMVKQVGPDGQPMRMPLAVDRLDVATLPTKFRLTNANAMMAGMPFEGNVFVIARVDRDGEARTREHGDLEGQVRATIPQKDLKLVLDTPVK